MLTRVRPFPPFHRLEVKHHAVLDVVVDGDEIVAEMDGSYPKASARVWGIYNGT